MMQDEPQNVEKKQHEGAIVFPLMDGCSENMWEAGFVVHIHSFDPPGQPKGEAPASQH